VKMDFGVTVDESLERWRGSSQGPIREREQLYSLEITVSKLFKRETNRRLFEKPNSLLEMDGGCPDRVGCRWVIADCQCRIVADCEQVL
jgi:hypothetical protein